MQRIYISSNIKKLRDNQGFTQGKLAEAINQIKNYDEVDGQKEKECYYLPHTSC
jgi:transcriptional regulator with XRE-family HTH domain